MWFWKLFMFLQIHPIRQKRQEKQEWKKGHEKQETYEIQDKKGKYLNIREVTDVIVWYCFQVRNIRNQHFFLLHSQTSRGWSYRLLTIMNAIKFDDPQLWPNPSFNPIYAGEVKGKGSRNYRLIDPRFLSTRYVSWNRVFLWSWEALGVKISQSILMSLRLDHMAGRHGLAKYVNEISQIWFLAPDLWVILKWQ